MPISPRLAFVAMAACNPPGEPLPEPVPPPVGGITFEQPSPISPQSPWSEVDNPELRTIVDLPNVTYSDTLFSFDGITLTTITTAPLAIASTLTPTPTVSYTPGDLQVFVTGGDGAADSNGLPLTLKESAVAANVIPWPNAAVVDVGGRADLVARGIRVGYTPLLVQTRNIAPDGTILGVLSSAAISLDPNVLLVPVQVLAVASAGVTNNTGLAAIPGALEVFDQVQAYTTTRVQVDQWPPHLPLTLITQRSFDTWMNPVPVSPTWLSGPFEGYRDSAFSGYDTPDSIWRDCGIQFRLVRFLELAAPVDLNKLPTNADISAACDQLILIADSRQLLTLPTVISMATVTSADPGTGAPCTTCPLGTTPASQWGSNHPVSCVGSHAYASAFPSPGFSVLAHELGHWSAQADCKAGVDPGCQFMDSNNRVVPPTNAECSSLRSWAQRWATYWSP